MKRRIYVSFLALILASVMLLTAALCLFFFYSFKDREIAAVKDNAVFIAAFMNRTDSAVYGDYAFDGAYYALRITVMNPDGTVLLDNKADRETMENHIDRAEIQAAFRSGFGEATRYSNTLLADTYYYAVRLDNGCVLRLAKAVHSIADVFAGALPVVFILSFLTLCCANFAARRLTDQIIKPLFQADLNGDQAKLYDELSPYVKKINLQQQELDEKIKALKDRTDTIETITQNMREGLILIDTNGLILSANKSAADIFGTSAIIHKSILHACRDMAFQEAVMTCLSGVFAEIHFDWQNKVYQISFNPVSDEGNITGGVILLTDVTERCKAEQQRREFSANVSHELKTPLTSISALAEMIRNGMATEADTRSFADRIFAQTNRLINIINDIIKLSEFDEHKTKASRTQFDLWALAESVTDSLEEKASAKNVAIRLTGQPLQWTANRQMIDELLYNLIDNAIKYNKENGNVTVALSNEGSMVKIAVSDTGIGIPQDHQNRVFERFYRVDHSRSKKTGGTGLGLSIVKHIAEYHGGGVALTSTPDEGTTVVCYMRE